MKAGQTLFRLEEADYLYRVQEARASLAARRVALLQEEEQAAIARAQYELYSSGRGRDFAVGRQSPHPEGAQLEAARAALAADEALVAAR